MQLALNIFELCGSASIQKHRKKVIHFNFYSEESFKLKLKLNKIAMAAAVLAIGVSAATASFAREASEGPRGEGAGHPTIDSQGAIVA